MCKGFKIKDLLISIESSCDDSSIAITQIESKKILFHKKISQDSEHCVYGGVVPELASRLHIKALPKILNECKQYFDRLAFVAVTTEPGLSVTLVEGVTMAKAISLSFNIPLIEVNHLYGHIFSLFLEKKAIYPLDILLISGGHTQILSMRSVDDIKLISSTIDDSFGESFDKVAKMLNLGYPGGPIVEKCAKNGDENSFNFTIPMKKNKSLDFSYSGLKNAVRLAIEKERNLNQQTINNICASFQKIATLHLIDKTKKYLQNSDIKDFAIVGGASANFYVRDKFLQLCNQLDKKLHLSQLEFCSDNAAMIGRFAIEKLQKGDK